MRHLATYMSLTQVLIQAGAVVNDPDDSGMTPLVAACHTGHLELVELALEQMWMQLTQMARHPLWRLQQKAV